MAANGSCSACLLASGVKGEGAIPSSDLVDRPLVSLPAVVGHSHPLVPEETDHNETDDEVDEADRQDCCKQLGKRGVGRHVCLQFRAIRSDDMRRRLVAEGMVMVAYQTRYVADPVDDGSWRVLDRVTGQCVTLNNHLLQGISVEEADDLVDVLNAYERQRLASARH